MALFRSHGSMQVLRLPLSLTIVTVLFTQTVGSSTISITSSSSIGFDSAQILGHKVAGTRLGG